MGARVDRTDFPPPERAPESSVSPHASSGDPGGNRPPATAARKRKCREFSVFHLLSRSSKAAWAQPGATSPGSRASTAKTENQHFFMEHDLLGSRTRTGKGSSARFAGRPHTCVRINAPAWSRQTRLRRPRPRFPGRLRGGCCLLPGHLCGHGWSNCSTPRRSWHITRRSDRPVWQDAFCLTPRQGWPYGARRSHYRCRLR